jgi:long-chain fatty acid transport protein
MQMARSIRLLFMIAGWSSPLHASFIESSLGAAIVNDATAAYYNPSALSVLKQKQIIGLGSLGTSKTEFSGQSTQLVTGFTQVGSANPTLNYLLPSIYFGLPVNKRWSAGLALVANDFNRDIDGHSILRYALSSNQVQDYDVVPAVSFRVNEFLSLGGSVNYSRAHFLMQPISGFSSLNIPDSQSRNETWGQGLGADLGLLFKPTKTMLVGFNYRSSITYNMGGDSQYNGTPPVVSSSYHFKYWTPARSVLSIGYMKSQQLGFIGTVQYIQWNIFKNISIYDIATQRGIISSANLPYYLRNTWLFTLGSNYRITPKWTIRGAGSYAQSPSNGRFQIDHGDSVTLGVSMAYNMNTHLILDGSYAHAFIKNQEIQVASAQNSIYGINKGAVDAVAIKLTYLI